MLLLAIDTSGKQGSIALARAGEPSADGGDVEVIEIAPLVGGTFSAQLIPQIADLLSQQRIYQERHRRLRRGLGPGSFTGLRIGLAAVKALAEVLESRLRRCLCWKCASSRAALKARSWLHSMRAEVMSTWGSTKSRQSRQRSARAHLERSEFLVASEGMDRGNSGFRSCRSGRRGRVDGLTLAPISAADVARLGWRKIQSGETVTPEQLEANYIRRTDAEMLEESVPSLRVRRAKPHDIPAMMALQRESPAAANWSQRAV